MKIVGFRVVESLAIPMQKCSDFRTKKKRNTRAKENLNRIIYFVITYKSSIDIQRSNDDKHRNYTIIQRLCYHPVNPLNSH